MSTLVKALIGVGVLLTAGGVAMVVSAGGSGEGLSIGFILGISAVFVVYAVGLMRWKRRWHAPDFRQTSEPVSRRQGWAALDKRLAEARNPLVEPLRAYSRSLLQRDDQLMRSQDALATIHPSSPYIPAEDRLPGWLGTGQAVLVTLGLMGTFIGLTIGLFEAVPLLAGAHPNPDEAMTLLLGGARLAFSKSVAGMYWSVVWLFFFREAEQEYDEIFQDLATYIDDSVPRASVEALLWQANDERAAGLERLVQALSQRVERAERPMAVASGGAPTDLGPLVEMLGRLERALSRPPERPAEKIMEQLSEAISRMTASTERLPTMLAERGAKQEAAFQASQQAVQMSASQQLQESHVVVQEFRAAGQELCRQLQEVNRAAAAAAAPIRDAASTLSQVQYALTTEREAFENLRRLAGTQAQDLREHLGEVDQRLGTLQNGYQTFHAQSLANMDAWQKQMLEFLPEMERRLHFPGYVKELEQALAMEAESRRDLVEVLKKLGVPR